MGAVPRVASSPTAPCSAVPRAKLMRAFRPHPEEHCDRQLAIAMRLEGWRRVRSLRPSFETAPTPTLPRKRGRVGRGLLRMRIRISFAHGNVVVSEIVLDMA